MFTRHLPQEKSTLKVVPVIDILDGVAVHAVKGRRNDYKPLKSLLSKSADPMEVATAFQKLGFTEVYVADLNAIMGNHDNFSVLKRVAEATRLQLMVDAGVNDIKTAKGLIQHGASKVIIGTETLTSIGFIEEAIRTLGPQRVIVSLDMKNEQLLSKLNPCEFSDPIDVLLKLQRMGLTQATLLDLARVGSREGVDVTFLKKVLECVDLEVFVGGGVRDIDDLVQLKDLGVFGALIATALHSGKIKMEDLKRAGLRLP
jgi:phosphoribosylformimino-5-aminoimidazole carboxamide ribotide isomerase